MFYQIVQSRDEAGYIVDTCRIGVRGNFPVEIEDHVDLFHRFEYRIVKFIRFNASVRVSGNTSRVGLDT